VFRRTLAALGLALIAVSGQLIDEDADAAEGLVVLRGRARHWLRGGADFTSDHVAVGSPSGEGGLVGEEAGEDALGGAANG
jgi:hypothetical protein